MCSGGRLCSGPRVLGTTQERMLREMAEALNVVTAAQPLVLVLEDLHWSDYATLDLLAALARRREPARFLLLGTYRPPDALHRGHPLQTVTHELHMHGQCAELPLTLLSEAAVADYLAARFPEAHFPAGLARLVQEIVWQGDAERRACQGILEQFAAYARARPSGGPDPNGAW